MEQGPDRPPNRRLVGLAGLLVALRNLGLLGRSAAGDDGMSHFVADDGQRIPVFTAGTGVPIVLVHGLACSHRNWMPVARRLARHARVHVWDARCHGSCVAETSARLTLQRLALDLRQMIEHFQLDRVVLVGHSMGALTVLQYLQDHGKARALAVALVDQSPRVVTDPEWRLGLFGGCSREMIVGTLTSARNDLPGTIVRQLEVAAGGWLQRRPGARAALDAMLRRWLGTFDATPLLNLAESLTTADFRPLLPTLDMPVWVVLGGQSPHYGGVPLEAYFRRAVCHAAITVYDRAGHSPHVAEPVRFANELLAFLADHA